MQHAETRSRQTFPSTNYWGIPDLLPELVADVAPGPGCEVLCWRTQRLSEPLTVGNILVFYVEDYRFSGTWTYPARMVAALQSYRLAAIAEPDFSLWADRPLAEQLHAVYRTRWVGRYWQEHGLRVIPSLNWSTAESYGWAWAGVPAGVPIAAVECRTCRGNRGGFNAGLAAACDQVKPRRLLIYGCGQSWVDVPSGVEPIWIEPVTNARFKGLSHGRSRRELGRGRRVRRAGE